MVYYIGSFRKTRFNRNILYCKLSYRINVCKPKVYLIETFCIVNKNCDRAGVTNVRI